MEEYLIVSGTPSRRECQVRRVNAVWKFGKPRLLLRPAFGLPTWDEVAHNLLRYSNATAPASADV
jgi:hypothetical protein